MGSVGGSGEAVGVGNERVLARLLGTDVFVEVLSAEVREWKEKTRGMIAKRSILIFQLGLEMVEGEKFFN